LNEGSVDRSTNLGLVDNLPSNRTNKGGRVTDAAPGTYFRANRN